MFTIYLQSNKWFYSWWKCSWFPQLLHLSSFPDIRILRTLHPRQHAYFIQVQEAVYIRNSSEVNSFDPDIRSIIVLPLLNSVSQFSGMCKLIIFSNPCVFTCMYVNSMLSETQELVCVDFSFLSAANMCTIACEK